MLVEHMSKGHSFESFGAVVNVGRKTLYDWADNNPEFKEAKELGDEKVTYLIEQVLICHLRGLEVKGINMKYADKATAFFMAKTRTKGLYVERVLLSQDDTELEFA